MPAPTIVPDTNLFLAAHWNRRSASARILEMAGRGEVRLAISPTVEREIFATLRRIHPRAEYLQWVRGLLAGAVRVEPTVHLRLILEDPEDDKLVECAATARADYLVTNDEHLLQVWRWEGTQIVTPSRFLALLRAGRAGSPDTRNAAGE